MRMNKLYTPLVFVLSFLVVFGGWFLTVKLLKQKEDKFLSGTGAVTLRPSEIMFLTENGTEHSQETVVSAEDETKEAGAEPTVFQGEVMSEDKRALVLSEWEKTETEVLHDPWEGQMNMEQAVEAGRNWIKSMAGWANIPEELAGCDFDHTYASLRTPNVQIQYYSETDEARESYLFDYWIVQFEKSGVTICLKIHAASGEIWYADFSLQNGSGLVEAYAQSELLEQAFPFIREDGEASKTAIDTRNHMVYLSCPKELVYAAVRQYEIHISGQGPMEVTVFWLYKGGAQFKVKKIME